MRIWRRRFGGVDARSSTDDGKRHRRCALVLAHESYFRCLCLSVLLAAVVASKQAPVPLSICGESLLEEAGWGHDHVAVLPAVSQALLSLHANASYDTSWNVRCQLKIDVCASCQIRVDFPAAAQYLSQAEIQEFMSCGPSEECLDIRLVENRADWVLDSPYRVLHVLAAETPFFLSTGPSIRIIASVSLSNSSSRLLQFYRNLFPLNLTVVDSTELITGSSVYEKTFGYIQSPRYPLAYPRNMEKTWILENNYTVGRVRLVFEDFQIHYQSELTVEGADDKFIVNSRSHYRRPPAIISSTNVLKVSLKARDFTQQIGFRARYEFVETDLWLTKPVSTDCDDVLDAYGGEFRWRGEDSSLSNAFLDCIWIFGKRGTGRMSVFDQVYLKVREFNVSGTDLQLEVRQGITSVGERLLVLDGAQSAAALMDRQPQDGLTASPGFYVRLRGFVRRASGLRIEFAQFYRWATAQCLSLSETHCDNGRCIRASLRCDGIDNCGDGSDEVCDAMDAGSYGVSARENMTHVVLLVLSGLGALIMMMVAGICVSRIFRRSPGTPSVMECSGTPAEVALTSSTAPMMAVVGQRRFYVAPLHELTVIEAPPTYDDALKHPQAEQAPSYDNAAFAESPSTSNLPAPQQNTSSSSTSSSSSPRAEASAKPEDAPPSTEQHAPPRLEHDDDELGSWV